MKRRPRLLKAEELKAKRRQWDRMKRGPRKIDWNKVPDDDAELVAVERGRAHEAITVLRERGLNCWEVGPVDKFCGRRDHQSE
jgi:hypothetical protein